MRRFTKLTLLLAMLLMASNNLYAAGTDAYQAGISSNAGGFRSLAVGYQNTASGEYSSAVGYQNTASGESSSIFGYSNTAEAKWSSSVGSANIAKATGSSAIGYGNYTENTAQNSSAFGTYNSVDAENSSAFGYKNYASSANSLVLGLWNNWDENTMIGFTENGEYSSAVGYNNYTPGECSGAFGYKNKASGGFSSAFGYYNEALGEDSSAFGCMNEASGDDSSVFGCINNASGERSNAFGYYNNASAEYSNAFGSLNMAFGGFSSAFGSMNIALGENSSAFGYYNLASGKYSSAFGALSRADAANSTAIGYEAVTSEENTVSFGHSIGDLDVSDNEFTSDYNVRLVHVAAGTADTDAVNYGQFKLAYTDASFDTEKNQLVLKSASGENKFINIPTGSGTGPDEELQKTVKQHTENINKLLAELGTSKDKKENKPSDGSIAIGDSNISGETDKVAMAIGSENEVTGKNSIAIGYSIDGQHNEVSGDYSIAVGFGHKVSGNKSGAFGDPNIVSGAGSYAFGNDNTISGNGSFILGNNSKITADNSVALGNNITIAHNNAVAIGEGSKTTADNTVSVGSESNKRRITNVAKAEDDFDAVNYDQLKSYVAAHAGGGDPQEVLRLRSDMGKLDSRISKVGAGAAALAALKPMEFDPDNRWSAGVGFGNLNGKSAAAVGIFYRPNRDVYYSLGGNVGGEENIVNAGVSFSFGHRSERSIVKQYNSAEHAELEAFRKENAGLKDKVAAQDAEINDLKSRMKRLEHLIVKMSKEEK